MVLLPVLPPLDRESTISWCCRLAPFHTGLSGPDWLRMMQISRQSVVDTSEACVDRLADLTGIPFERIRAMGVLRKGDRTFLHRAEEFGVRFALRTHTTYCPICLLEDSDPGSPSAGSRVGRIDWMFSPIRTCEAHGIVLTRRQNRGYFEQFQDMALVAPENAELERQAATAERRSVSPLQRYVERRFAGDQISGWLDGQPIDQAVRACEMLGACLAFGAHTDLDKLSLTQWDEAGAVGFQAATAGAEGICRALENITIASRTIKGPGGPQAAYGRLYQWLQFKKSEKEPGPIRDVIREHILETLPVDPGTKLFGEIVATRRRHSVASLSALSGIHRKTLNRALVRTEIIVGGGEERIEPTTSFDALAGEALAHRIRASIPVREIPGYLNCNRTQGEMLVKLGIIAQLVPGLGRRGGVLTNVATEDLNHFLECFRSAGRPVAIASAGMMDVIAAADPARHPVTDIVKLVLGGKLSRVEVIAADLGFRSVLVDPEEVRKVVDAGEEEAGLSAHEVAEWLGIFPSGVSHLRKTADRDGLPFLRAREICNARGTVRYRFDAKDVARFQAAHVTLTALAIERGVSAKAMSRALSAAGIEPIMRRDLLNAAMFRRADL